MKSRKWTMTSFWVTWVVRKLYRSFEMQSFVCTFSIWEQYSFQPFVIKMINKTKHTQVISSKFSKYIHPCAIQVSFAWYMYWPLHKGELIFAMLWMVCAQNIDRSCWFENNTHSNLCHKNNKQNKTISSNTQNLVIHPPRGTDTQGRDVLSKYHFGHIMVYILASSQRRINVCMLGNGYAPKRQPKLSVNPKH
jgi:ABC-type dipeptide/oligopeptide/nickel transport system permease subunit